MTKYRVRILSGCNINHFWTVDADNKRDALQKVRDSFKVYGIPYDIEKDGIIFSDVYPLEEINQ